MDEQACIDMLNSCNSDYNDALLILFELDTLISEQTEKVNNDYEQVVASVDLDVSSKTEGDFNWNYAGASSNMHLVSNEDVANYILNNGGTKISDKEYSVTIKGVTYKYNVVSGNLSDGKNSIRCRFYMTDGTKLGKITNTITVLPGSGEVNSGAIGKSGVISETTKLNKGSLVISPYGCNNFAENPDKAIECTVFGNYLAGNSNSQNSIIGFSQGSQAASAASAKRPDLYDKVVIVNGSSNFSFDPNADFVERNGSYSTFKGKEVIFIETKGNTKWYGSIQKSYSSFKAAGADVSLYTNDKDLASKINGSTYFNDNSYTSHGHGYKVIEGVNILSYLSS